MDKKFHEYKGLDLSQDQSRMYLKEWEANNTFERKSEESAKDIPLSFFTKGPLRPTGCLAFTT